MSDGFFYVTLQPNLIETTKSVGKLKYFGLKQISVSLLTLVLVLAGCKEPTREPASLQDAAPVATIVEDTTQQVVDTLQSEMNFILEREAVLQRVKDIYGVVKAEFLRRGSSVENELLDKAYCSQDWNKLLLAVRYKEHLTNTLFFEVNHWSMTTESGVVWFDEFEVTNLTLGPEKRATVAFTVYEDDTYVPAQVDMVYENGQWLIDNFYNMKYMMDIRERMWYFLETDMM